VIILAIYGLVFFLIYKASDQKYKTVLNVPKQKRTKRTFWTYFIATILFSLFIFASGYGLLLFLFFLPFSQTLSFYGFIFTSSIGLVIIVSLFVIVTIASLAFNSLTDQAIAVKNATFLASFLGIGIVFLLIYHLLWSVYMVILTSLWPLKTFSPSEK